LAQQSLSDPQAAIAIGPNERLILAEHCRYSARRKLLAAIAALAAATRQRVRQLLTGR